MELAQSCLTDLGCTGLRTWWPGPGGHDLEHQVTVSLVPASNTLTWMASGKQRLLGFSRNLPQPGVPLDSLRALPGLPGTGLPSLNVTPFLLPIFSAQQAPRIYCFV